MSYTQTQEAMRRSLPEMQRALKGAKKWSQVRGSGATCPHPKHEDKEPSGWIKVGDDGIVRFSCRGCGFHGDIFEVLAAIENKAPGDVLAEVREHDNGTGTTHRPAPEPSTPARRPARTFKTCEELRAKVDGEKRARLQATFEVAHRYENPDTGRVDLLILRYRKPPKLGQTKGKKDMPQFHQRPDGLWVEGKPPGKQPMYRRKENRGAKSILLVEGEVKVDTLLAMGFNATCWPGGGGAVEEADLDWLDGMERITLWPDNDDPGRVAMKQFMARLSHLPNPPEIAWIEPADFELEKGEDVVDLIAKCKREGTDPKEVIAGAIASARTSNLSEGLRDRFEDIISGVWYALAFPFLLLSRLSKALLPQNVCIVAGRPGAVKSFFVLRILLHWFAQGVRFAYLSLEEDRTFVNWRLVAMLECNGNLLDDEWVKAHPDESRAAYERHNRELDRFNRSVWERPGEQVTLEWVTEWIRNRAHEGYRVIVVDPITICRPAAQPWIADHEFVSAVEHMISTCNTSLLLVTHCTKGAQLLDLDSVAGGAAYQRLCQSLLLLERHKPAKQVVMMNPDINMGRFQCRIDETVHICKARKGKGQGMSIGYTIDWGTMQFAEQGVVIKEPKNQTDSGKENKGSEHA